jgi:hypothetical protein
MMLDPEQELVLLSQIAGCVHQIDFAQVVVQAVRRIAVGEGKLGFDVDARVLRNLISEDLEISVPQMADHRISQLNVPFEVSRTLKGAWRIEPQNQKPDIFDLPPHELCKLIRGVIWRDEYFRGKEIPEIAKREQVDQSHVHRLIRRSLEIA